MVLLGFELRTLCLNSIPSTATHQKERAKEKERLLGTVAHAYNLSYMGSRTAVCSQSRQKYQCDCI
jgi:hypothetical protein